MASPPSDSTSTSDLEATGIPEQPAPGSLLSPESQISVPSTEALGLQANHPPILDQAPPPVASGRLSERAQALLDALVEGPKDDLRRETLKQLPLLPSTEASDLAAAILQHLPKEADGWARSWMITALGVMNHPGTIRTVLTYSNASFEKFDWVRYWAVLALVRMQLPNLADWLEWLVRNERSSLVIALACRLLVERGREEYIDHLKRMAGEDFDARWAALRALRRPEGTQSFRPSVEGKFMPVLESRLFDRRESADVRFEAAKALGDVQHKWQEAIKLLSRVLEEDIPDWLRRTCVDALSRIGKPEIKDGLLTALHDLDAGIRVRAACSLKQVLGAEIAIEFIADELLRSDQPPPELLDALRQIDQNAASQALSEKVLHPDPKVAERARLVLLQLGGEHAMRVLQRQREELLKTHTDMLRDADKQIMNQFEGLIKQARYAFVMTMAMHGLIFGLGVVVLSAGLYIALAAGSQQFERFIGVGAAASSLTILLTLFYRDPLKNIRESVSSLVRVNVLFIGYMRQVNQIDASFKQLFLSAGGFGTNEMKQTVEQLQGTVSDTMAKVKEYLAD